jgi:hypothetical protein
VAAVVAGAKTEEKWRNEERESCKSTATTIAKMPPIPPGVVTTVFHDYYHPPRK